MNLRPGAWFKGMAPAERSLNGPPGRTVFVVFAVLLGYMAFVFPGFGGLRLTPAPDDPSFDLRFTAAPKESLALAAAMDPGARRASIISHWTYDLVYPALYGAFMFIAWRWSLGKLGAGAARARLLSRLTLAAPLLDLAENACIAWLLAAVASPESATVGAVAVDTVSVGAAEVGTASASARAAAILLSAATPAKWVAVVPALTGTIIVLAFAALRTAHAKSSID